MSKPPSRQQQQDDDYSDSQGSYSQGDGDDYSDEDRSYESDGQDEPPPPRQQPQQQEQPRQPREDANGDSGEPAAVRRLHSSSSSFDVSLDGDVDYGYEEQDVDGDHPGDFDDDDEGSGSSGSQSQSYDDDDDQGSYEEGGDSRGPSERDNSSRSGSRGDGGGGGDDDDYHDDRYKDYDARFQQNDDGGSRGSEVDDRSRGDNDGSGGGDHDDRSGQDEDSRRSDSYNGSQRSASSDYGEDAGSRLSPQQQQQQDNKKGGADSFFASGFGDFSGGDDLSKGFGGDGDAFAQGGGDDGFGGSPDAFGSDAFGTTDGFGQAGGADGFGTTDGFGQATDGFGQSDDGFGKIQDAFSGASADGSSAGSNHKERAGVRRGEDTNDEAPELDAFSNNASNDDDDSGGPLEDPSSSSRGPDEYDDPSTAPLDNKNDGFGSRGEKQRQPKAPIVAASKNDEDYSDGYDDRINEPSSSSRGPNDNDYSDGYDDRINDPSSSSRGPNDNDYSDGYDDRINDPSSSSRGPSDDQYYSDEGASGPRDPEGYDDDKIESNFSGSPSRSQRSRKSESAHSKKSVGGIDDDAANDGPLDAKSGDFGGTEPMQSNFGNSPSQSQRSQKQSTHSDRGFDEEDEGFASGGFNDDDRGPPQFDFDATADRSYRSERQSGHSRGADSAADSYVSGNGFNDSGTGFVSGTFQDGGDGPDFDAPADRSYRSDRQSGHSRGADSAADSYVSGNGFDDSGKGFVSGTFQDDGDEPDFDASADRSSRRDRQSGHSRGADSAADSYVSGNGFNDSGTGFVSGTFQDDGDEFDATHDKSYRSDRQSGHSRGVDSAAGSYVSGGGFNESSQSFDAGHYDDADDRDGGAQSDFVASPNRSKRSDRKSGHSRGADSAAGSFVSGDFDDNEHMDSNYNDSPGRSEWSRSQSGHSRDVDGAKGRFESGSHDGPEIDDSPDRSRSNRRYSTKSQGNDEDDYSSGSPSRDRSQNNEQFSPHSNSSGADESNHGFLPSGFDTTGGAFSGSKQSNFGPGGNGGRQFDSSFDKSFEEGGTVRTEATALNQAKDDRGFGDSSVNSFGNDFDMGFTPGGFETNKNDQGGKNAFQSRQEGIGDEGFGMPLSPMKGGQRGMDSVNADFSPEDESESESHGAHSGSQDSSSRDEEVDEDPSIYSNGPPPVLRGDKNEKAATQAGGDPFFGVGGKEEFDDDIEPQNFFGDKNESSDGFGAMDRDDGRGSRDLEPDAFFGMQGKERRAENIATKADDASRHDDQSVGSPPTELSGDERAQESHGDGSSPVSYMSGEGSQVERVDKVHPRGAGFEAEPLADVRGGESERSGSFDSRSRSPSEYSNSEGMYTDDQEGTERTPGGDNHEGSERSGSIDPPSLDGSSRMNDRKSIASAEMSKGGEPASKKKSTKRKGYTREQMTKLKSAFEGKTKEEEDGPNRIRLQGKSVDLLHLNADVNSAMVELERIDQEEALPEDLSSSKLLHNFEALVGILLQLSDELELMSSFAASADPVAIEALQTLLGFARPISDLFFELKPILLNFLTEDAGEDMVDFFFGMILIVDLLCELCQLVGEKQLWDPRANTAVVTLLELLARDTLEVTSIYDDVDTPDYELTEDIRKAWQATGHDEIATLETLGPASELSLFRQICYEVMLSTDQWCPDANTLMDICGIDESVEDSAEPNPDDVLSPSPEAAIQILDKIRGDFLARMNTLAGVIRRILPPSAVFDPALRDTTAKVRTAVLSPSGLSPSTIVAITSIPESLDDENALGVAGVGKSTMAAIVANHADVRRFFNDGVAWIHIGHTELNFNRYVQCMKDIMLQLQVPEEDEPNFPEMLHSPGESTAKRRRREEGYMIYVRETMVEFLRVKNVLIVLDDVCFEPDLDWFDFNPAPEGEADAVEGNCVVLFTSRRRDILPTVDTVEVDMLEEDEAVQLLIQEAGELSHAMNKDTPEIRSVVRECANHPLAVKSVGRWLNLKHATTAAQSSVEEVHEEVIRSMGKILKSGGHEDVDMMYEILNLSLSPAINGEPTSIIKFCLAAFVRVFCEREHLSDFALAQSTSIIPLPIAELLLEALLDLEEETLLQEGSLFHAQKKEASRFIPEALAALGVFKVITTIAEQPPQGTDNDNENARQVEEKFVHVMHVIQQEYAEYLYDEDPVLTNLTKDGEKRWNKAFSQAYLAKAVDWDTEFPDASLDYALEMIPTHMVRGEMYSEVANLLSNPSFVRGRLFALGREDGTRRQIKDCETFFKALAGKKLPKKKKVNRKQAVKNAYQVLSEQLPMDEQDLMRAEGSQEAIEVARCLYEIGFSLTEMRAWEAAISHWDRSQELFVSSVGMVEIVAGILYNVGVVYGEMNEYEQALGSLKQCLKIRSAIHGEDHILYARTIQKIGDMFLRMSDYREAMESYDWALDVMRIQPSHHRVDIGDILENIGNIHYSKGEIDEALQCYQESLQSKQADLGDDHPELSSTYQNIGNCLSDQGETEEAISHFEEAIRLKRLDPDGGGERDADILTIEGVLHNLNGKQQLGLECYEKALQTLVTKVPHKKEKVASLLHLIGCVYLMSGEHKKAMKLFEESLQARRKVLGFVHLDVASTLFNMAFLHQSRNRLDKALKCLEEALKIRQLRLPDSEKVAVTHEKIGNMARVIGKTKKAEIAFGEALRIRKLVHGDKHEAVATVLQELGDLNDDLGEYDQSMKFYVEALEIRESRLGPDDLAVAETYYSMGFTLQKNGATDRALQCFEEALSIRKYQLGDEAKEVGDTLNMMGFLQAKRGELDDALSLLHDALKIRKLHEDYVKVSETYKNIGNVHREQEEYELAMLAYENCLKIRRDELGDEHEKVADALIAMGNLQGDMELTGEAMNSYKEALTIRTMRFGEQHQDVAAVLQSMGSLQFRAGDLELAYELLDEFIRIRKEIGSVKDEDYVNVLFMIGNIQKLQGNLDDAQRSWTEAYGIFKELGLEKRNPQIAEVMGKLVKDSDKHETESQHDAGDFNDDEQPLQQPKGMFGRLTQKVKSATKKKNRGHQL